MKRALTDKDTILPEAKKRNNQAEPLLQDVPMETTGVCLMVFNTTFNNISVISWQSVLLVEKTGGSRENH
jgi:hypothetical protein